FLCIHVGADSRTNGTTTQSSVACPLATLGSADQATDHAPDGPVTHRIAGLLLARVGIHGRAGREQQGRGQEGNRTQTLEHAGLPHWWITYGRKRPAPDSGAAGHGPQGLMGLDAIRTTGIPQARLTRANNCISMRVQLYNQAAV